MLSGHARSTVGLISRPQLARVKQLLRPMGASMGRVRRTSRRRLDGCKRCLADCGIRRPSRAVASERRTS
jgi:hypothetical protein